MIKASKPNNTNAPFLMPFLESSKEADGSLKVTYIGQLLQIAVIIGGGVWMNYSDFQPYVPWTYVGDQKKG